MAAGFGDAPQARPALMRVELHPKLDRQLDKAPAEVREWALDWIEAAESPDATLESVVADASPLKGDMRGYFARKWRRGAEYRLVFRASEDDGARFISLEPRGGDYKIAKRRIRADR